ncbi:MAG TPA: InlB B-repeat-containing protein, partial [Thermoclostridium sp.]
TYFGRFVCLNFWYHYKEGVTYRVKHIRQDLDGTYPDDGELVEYVEMTGTSGNYTIGREKAYEGFTALEFSQQLIEYDGSTEVEIHYSRNSYQVTWMVDGDVYKTGNVKYGATITKPQEPKKPGYVFKRWDGFTEHTAMDSTAKTYTATWKPATDTPYTVKHILADQDGNHDTGDAQVYTETRHGIAGTQTNATVKYYPGFTAQSVAQEEIQADGKMVVTIYYDRNEYTVTWVVYNNNIFTTTDVKFGNTISVPGGAPTKTGYSFSKWQDIPETMPDKNISIMAEFTPDEYVVTLDTNRGTLTVSECVYVTYHSEYGILPEPAFEGFLFDGWEDEYGTIITGKTIVNIPRNHKLKAIWVDNDNAVQYKVRHMLQNANNDGYTECYAENRYGNPGSKTNAKANTYAGFTALPFSQATISENGGDVVEIYYIRNAYNVTWNINGEEKKENYRFGQNITEPKVNIPGYNFIGWNITPETTMPDSDLVYTAQLAEANYTVRFNGNGGNDISELTVIYNSVYPALPESSRTGYTFTGWFTEAEGGTRVKAGDIVNITDDITLYAHWAPKTYSVKFNLNGLEGETPETITVTYGEMYGSLPDVTGIKTGYHFKGWYTAPNGGEPVNSNTTVNIAEDITLYAQLAPNTYTVKFNANGGSGIMPDQLHTYGKNLALPEIKFSKDGYTFTGWNTKADGSGTSYKNKEIVINMTEVDGDEINLYAQWIINSYTITFNSAGGTPVQAITGEYETEISEPDDPAKYGYSFEGWMNGDKLVTFPVKLTENLNLTASWKAVEYDIIYIGMDGVENSNPASYTIENDAMALSAPGAKTGYTFMGWFRDESLSDDSRVNGVAIASGSTGVRTFYAGWKANLYGVNFDDGTGSNNAGGSMSAQVFTYDMAQALKSNEFANTGYNFIGWGIEPNSEVVYTDGQIVSNLVPYGSITLYAQWEPIKYAISYTLGSGASGANNPTSYTIETPDITLKNPSGIKAGYQFLGWYSGDTKVTSVPKGSTGNVLLTARWAHGGIFTLEKTGEKANGSAKDITFTVTRTFPSDTVPTSDVQRVYYRTVNGTAIGGTAAPIHFSHVGGEDVFLTFNQNDTAKTFVVKSERYFAGNDDIVNSFTNGVSRYYDVELYRVVSPQGNCTGTLGSSPKVRRTIAQGSDYVLDKSFFSNYYWSNTDYNKYNITDSGFDKNPSRTITIDPGSVNMKETYRLYAKSTVSDYLFGMFMQVTENDDGYQYINVESTSNSSRYYKLKFEIREGAKHTTWENHYVPMATIRESTVIKLTEYSTSWMELFNFSTSLASLRVATGETFKIRFDASGSGNDDWQYTSFRHFLSVYDITEPKVKRIAPLAYSNYKTGDTITIAVEFNEIIGSVSNVKLGSFSQIPVNSWTYVDGVGTNMLVFKGTLTKDFAVNPDMNTALAKITPTVSGTIKDMAD